MSSLKLKHSGGNSVSIAAPSSNPAANRTLTVPSNADGTILTNSTPGCILQVVQTVKTDTFSVGGTNTADITGMSINITPASTSNKILISYHLSMSVTQGGFSAFVHLFRDSTQIFLGDTDGNRQRTSNFHNSDVGAANNSDYAAYDMYDLSGQFLDSPSTTSQITYKLQARSLNSSGTFYLNRSPNDQNASSAPRTASTITVMEVAG